MRIWLAPLQGYTDYVFRNVYARHFSGIDVAVSPFISLVPGETVVKNRIKDVLLENNNSNIPIIPQILGNDPYQYLTLINRLKPLGYNHFNWNCGCPAHVVAKKKRGSGILPYPEIINNTLQQVLSNTDAKLSVKLRLGYNSPNEMFDVIEVLNQHKLEYVIIHPRLGIQQYEGTVDLDGFETFSKLIKHPLVYNGDISNIEDYEYLITRFPNIKEIMLGRGVLKSLSLPSKIKYIEATQKEAKTLFEQSLINTTCSFYDDFIETQAANRQPEHLIGVIKQYWVYFQHNFNVDDETMTKLLRSTELKEVLNHGKTIIQQYEQI